MLALIAAALVVSGSLCLWTRPESTCGQFPDEDSFWQFKAKARAEWDLVAVGDSRLYRGFSPHAAQYGLGVRARILNFGWSSAGLTTELLDAAAHLLDPAPGRRGMLIGITAHSLTDNEDARANRHWHTVSARAIGSPRMSATGADLLGRAFPSFVPSPIRSLLLLDQADGSEVYLQTYWTDGWVESQTVPRDSERALASYRKSFLQSAVAQENIDQLAAWIASARRRGIIIWCAIPPTTAAMDGLESELGRFDPVKVRKEVEAAGAQWLNVDRLGYDTYDGSHLEPASARKWSESMGRAMATYWDTGKEPHMGSQNHDAP